MTTWLRLALLALISLTAGARASDIAYSFVGDHEGGLALLQVDEARGKLANERVLHVSTRCPQAMKVRFAPAAQALIMTHESGKDPFLLIQSLVDDAARYVALPAKPDEVRVFGRKSLVTCGGQWVVVVDLPTGVLEAQFDAETSLTPHGHGPEDVLMLPDETQAVVSFQKDGKKGRTLGNRLVLFDLPSLHVAADLQLPRDRPQLHIPGNLKEQGPGPEVLLLSPDSDTLLVTLDLYGAVGLLKWSAFHSGNPSDPTYLTTSLDNTWGDAFPDRAGLVSFQGRPHALVFNAGEQGGAVLVDLQQRSVAWKTAAPSGLDKPVWLPGYQLAVAACSGKVKSRAADRTVKSIERRQAVHLFDLSGSEPVLQERPMDMEIFAAAQAHPTEPWIVLAERGPAGDELVLLNADTLRVLDRLPAHGRIQKLEARVDAVPGS